MNNSETLYNRRSKIVPTALGIFNPSTIISAEGAIITDADGRKLIDFAGGIGVQNAGHCPPPVVKAIQEQAGKFIHSCVNVSLFEKYIELCEKLAKLLPHGENTKVMLTNSGAESVENAVKIARQATGKPAIVCYNGSFHGRTMMAMTLTSSIKYKTGCGPFAPEVYRLDFPFYSSDEKKKYSEEIFVNEQIQKLKNFFSTQVSTNQTAAIIIELVQGEGGFNVAPKSYIKFLRQFCTENKILLIIDEVQSGFGRTCDWASYNHFEILPDISVWAKSIGGGMPIGAVIGKAEIMDKASSGTIGGTYLGNPLSCVSALATISYMEENKINERAKIVAKKVKSTFEKLQNKFPKIVYDVRGLGAMLAMEIRKPNNEPNPEFVKLLISKCHENGLIIISNGTYGNCVRILSPLIIEEEVLDKGLLILENSFEELM